MCGGLLQAWGAQTKGTTRNHFPRGKQGVQGQAAGLLPRSLGVDKKTLRGPLTSFPGKDGPLDMQGNEAAVIEDEILTTGPHSTCAGHAGSLPGPADPPLLPLSRHSASCQSHRRSSQASVQQVQEGTGSSECECMFACVHLCVYAGLVLGMTEGRDGKGHPAACRSPGTRRPLGMKKT